MSLLYHCNDCGGREFVIDDGKELEQMGEMVLVPNIYPPYCPYCGKKDGVQFIKEE